MPVISSGTFDVILSHFSTVGDWIEQTFVGSGAWVLVGALAPYGGQYGSGGHSGETGTITFITTGACVALNTAPAIDAASLPTGFTIKTCVFTPAYIGGVGGSSDPDFNWWDQGWLTRYFEGYSSSVGPHVGSGVGTGFPQQGPPLDIHTIPADLGAAGAYLAIMEGMLVIEGFADQMTVFVYASDTDSRFPGIHGIRITGTYDIIATWWLLPTDGCGSPSQLVLVAGNPGVSPGPGYVPQTLAFVPTVSVDSVIPVLGPIAGGTACTITGSGFGQGASVTFDGVAATSVVVVNQNTITCVTPAHAIGDAAVIVTNLITP